LIEAFASMKSFKPKGADDQRPPTGGGRNPERDFHGERRRNQTHASSTDPDARLFRKGRNKEAKLCHLGHLLMDNRHGLIVDAMVTPATGTAEREAAEAMLGRQAGRHRATLGADKGYDAAGLVAALRALKVTPHIAQNSSGRRSAIDRRTTRHRGYAVSQRVRQRIEEAFGWIKTVGGLRKTRHRGIARVGWMFTLTAAACNLIRLPKLLAAG
jgi:IS5 family transposase